MRVLDISVKGFRRENGEYSWTPEVRCEFEIGAPLLLEHQVNEIEAAIVQQQEIIKKAIEASQGAAVKKISDKKCIKCATLCEIRKSQAGNDVLYCPKCNDYRRRDGTEFPKGA